MPKSSSFSQSDSSRLSADAALEFRTPYLTTLPRPNPALKIAVLLTTEYEGLGQNGGVGTYYRELTLRLGEANWTIILVLLGGFLKMGKSKTVPGCDVVIDLADIHNVLILSPAHQDIRQACLSDTNKRIGFDALFLLQAIANRYEGNPVFAEFHEMFGFGYPSVMAKRAGILPSNCKIGITMHSGHEWIYDANRALSLQDCAEFIPIAAREEQAFKMADLPMYPSDSLFEIVKEYGWDVSSAIKIPYFIPVSQASLHPVLPGSQASSREIIFFGRLEERKGLFEFVAAILELARRVNTAFTVTFLGKSIQLYSTRSRLETSRSYINKKLSSHVSFQILSELSSIEANNYVIQRQNKAIVCLVSPTDNFPNAALEMGQIPVPLVVSDTTGFRQTLSLVERTAGLFWFQASSVSALVESLTQALAVNRDVSISVASAERIQEINRDLLEKRLKLIESKSQFQAPQLNKILWEPVQYQDDEPANISLSKALERAYQTKADYILSSRSGSIPPSIIHKLLQEASASMPDIIHFACEYSTPNDLNVYDVPSAISVVESEYAVPACLLIRRDTCRYYGFLSATTFTLLHQQLLSEAIITGKSILVAPLLPLAYDEYNLRVSPKEVSNSNHIRLLQYLTQIPPSQINRRAYFHLLLASHQLNQALVKYRPTKSISRNIRILPYLIKYPFLRYLRIVRSAVNRLQRS